MSLLPSHRSVSQDQLAGGLEALLGVTQHMTETAPEQKLGSVAHGCNPSTQVGGRGSEVQEFKASLCETLSSHSPPKKKGGRGQGGEWKEEREKEGNLGRKPSEWEELF